MSETSPPGASDAEIDRLRRLVHDHPGDFESRLRLGLQLFERGEWVGARRALSPIEASVPGPARAGHGIDAAAWGEAVALLARIDENEGHTQQAIRRWEAMLADDIHRPDARANLIRLREAPRPRVARRGPTRTDATLVSPEGLNTARYEIVKEIGRGATSTVYLARDRYLGIEVALKVLHPAMHAAVHARERERFFWEARAAARLRHPGVIAVYDLDEEARRLSLEYVSGDTLRTRLATAGPDGQPGPLPTDEIRAVTRGLLETLAYVHDTGLIHGDIKPRNVLLRRRGDPVLGDFGVSRPLRSAGTPDESPAGTPLFLAPEQLRGRPSSTASDIFAVGAIAWEMAVGRPLRSPTDLTSGHYDGHPLPADARGRLDREGPGLALLIERLTRPNPGERPASAHEALSSMP